MAMPVIAGEKTAGERFPGAVSTFTIEAMMQDKKALQAGTSHFLGQNFAKAQDIKYQSKTGTLEHCWTTSWGVSTRLIGALIMTHSDDDGLVLPPKLAPKQIVIIPIWRKEEELAGVLEYCKALEKELKAQTFGDEKVRVMIDSRDMNGGERTWDQIKKGVPIRVEVGPRDIASDSVFVGRRDKAPKDKKSYPRAEFLGAVAGLLGEIQDGLYERALAFRTTNSQQVDSVDVFKAYFEGEGGGFAHAFAADDPSYADLLKDLKVTARCMPNDDLETGTCIFTGQTGVRRVVFARAY